MDRHDHLGLRTNGNAVGELNLFMICGWKCAQVILAILCGTVLRRTSIGHKATTNFPLSNAARDYKALA